MNEKIFLVFILISFQACLCQSQTIMKTIASHPNGNRKEAAYFVGKKKVSTRWFDSRGIVTKQHGKIPDGYVYELYPDGKIMTRDIFKNNKVNGIRISYRKNGLVKSEMMFKDSLCDGKAVTYWENMQPYEIFFCSKGRLNGMYKVFSANGVLLAKEPYVNGYINGVSKQFHPDGMLKYEVSYSNSDKEGPFKVYDIKGRLLEIAYFENGILHGEASVFYPSGRKKYSDIYDRGIKIKRLMYVRGKVKAELPYI